MAKETPVGGKDVEGIAAVKRVGDFVMEKVRD